MKNLTLSLMLALISTSAFAWPQKYSANGIEFDRIEINSAHWWLEGYSDNWLSGCKFEVKLIKKEIVGNTTISNSSGGRATCDDLPPEALLRFLERNFRGNSNRESSLSLFLNTLAANGKWTGQSLENHKVLECTFMTTDKESPMNRSCPTSMSDLGTFQYYLPREAGE